MIRIGIGRGSQRGLSQLTRCHRGKQLSRGQAVGQCKRRKRWWQWMLFLYVFCLIERVVEPQTAGQEYVSFGQGQVNFQTEARGSVGVLEGWQVGWLGLFVWVGWRGRSVVDRRAAAGNA